MTDEQAPSLTPRHIWTFLGWTFAFGWGLQILAVLLGLQSSGRALIMLTMWAPALGAWLTGQEVRAKVKAAVRRASLRTWVVAFLLGCAFSTGQQLYYVFTQSGHWNAENFPLSSDGSGIEEIRRVGTVLGFWKQGWGYFSLNLALSVALSAIVFMPLGAVGEEIGWRAILQPAMVERHGAIIGTVLVGLIWGYWHLPANLAGYNDPQHPVLTTLLIFPCFTVAFAFVLAWLFKWSGSVWPAALAHAANNNLSARPLMMPGSWAAEQTGGLLSALVVGTIGVMLLVRAHRQR